MVTSDSTNSPPVVSSFLLFNDLCNVGVLRSLRAESDSSSYEGDSFWFPNHHFYPIQSRPGVLNIFQEWVEKVLSILHATVRQRGNENNSNLIILI